MKIKKLIAVCLTIVMVCTMMCVPAFASSGASEYEVEKDSVYIVNESHISGSEVFIRFYVSYNPGDGYQCRQFDVPVDLILRTSDDPYVDTHIATRVGNVKFDDLLFSGECREYNLGYFDFSSVVAMSVYADVYFNLPSGTYQISGATPFFGCEVSIGADSVFVPFCKQAVRKNGTTLVEFGYMPNGYSERVSLSGGNLNVQFTQNYASAPQYKVLYGKSGDLIVRFSPMALYVGEPLEDGLIYPPPAPIKDFIGNVSTIFHNVINWVALTAETIVSNPLILIFSIVPYIGLGVSIYARIKRTKK